MANLRSMVYRNSDKLNSSEKEILQFVMANPAECSKLSLAALAKKLYVSESAIFRLCKKIGLSGYSELRFGLEDMARAAKNAASMNSNFPKELKNAAETVVNYFETLDLDGLYADLEAAPMIYLYSTGWQQALIAQYLHHELFMIGKNATILPSALDELKIASSRAKAHDVFFIISFSGDNQEINDEIAHMELTNSQLKYVSFTNLRQNKLSYLAQYNLYFPAITYASNNTLPNGYAAFAPAYMLIDLFISQYLTWRQKNGKD